MHVRPAAAVNATLRRLHASGVRLVWASPGPTEATDVLLHHLGVARLVDEVVIATSASAPHRARPRPTRSWSRTASTRSSHWPASGGGDVIDDSDRRLETLLDRIEQLRRELEVIGRRLDGLEGLNRIADELHELNGSLQTLAYAALGRRGPDVRENR